MWDANLREEMSALKIAIKFLKMETELTLESTGRRGIFSLIVSCNNETVRDQFRSLKIQRFSSKDETRRVIVF